MELNLKIVAMKLENIHLSIVLATFTTRSITIIDRNLVGDESLFVEKLCCVLFGTDRLKITRNVMRQAAITQATRVARLQISDLGLQIAYVWLGKRNLANMQRQKSFLG